MAPDGETTEGLGLSTSDQDTPAPGRRLGRYELLSLLSRGGMGEIYLARTRGAGGFEKKIVIKRILSYLAEEEEFVHKFIDEANIVTHLTHGNIVPVFDMGEEGGELFIAMEYIAGQDLRALLKRCAELGQLPPINAALFIIGEVCKGLAYAHRKVDAEGRPLKIIHRDVSPSNVLISAEGEVKLVDFGIAKAAGRLSRSATGRLQGKFCYMSPEQAIGADVDVRSDVFSAGVVLYELLTGVRPFEGERDLESLERVKTHAPPPPSRLRPEIPAAIDAIVMKALAKDRDARYGQVDELERAIFTHLYAHGGMTSREVAQVLDGLFPEGFEPGASRHSGDFARVSLDDALSAEVDKLLADSADSADSGDRAYGAVDRGRQRPGGDRADGVHRADGVDPLVDTATGSAALSFGAASSSATPGTVSVLIDRPPLARVEPRAPRLRVFGDDTPAIPTEPSKAPQPPAPSQAQPEVKGEPDAPSPSPVPTGPAPEAAPRPRRRWRILAAVVGLGLLAMVLVLSYKLSFEPPTLLVRTTPAGATVLVDGVPVGLSGDPIRGLLPGSHEITVRLDGYTSPEPTSILLTRGDDIRMPTLRLEPIRPAVAPRVKQVSFVTQPPGAAIVIDNTTVGTTPGAVNISEERPTTVTLVPNGLGQSFNIIIQPPEIAARYTHDFEVAQPQTPESDVGPPQNLEPDAGQTPPHDRPAEEDRVRVSIESTPSGAEISINGSPTGRQTPAALTLPLGRVRVRLDKPGFRASTQIIQTNLQSAVQMTLDPLSTPEPEPEALAQPAERVMLRTWAADQSGPLVSTFTVNGLTHDPRNSSLVIDLAPGTYKVTATATAYPYAGAQSVTVVAGGKNRFTINLSRIPQ